LFIAGGTPNGEDKKSETSGKADCSISMTHVMPW
jgi:hypothetical protein